MATKKTPYFRTPLTKRETTYSNAGKKLEEVMAMRLDEKGNEEFYISGVKDVHAEIQAHKDEVNLEKIIARCVETGDMTILNQVKKEYIDLTEVPKSLIEAKNKINKAESEFYQLPIEIRKQYENNFNKYLADVGSENWYKIMNPEPKSEVLEQPKKEEGVAENEQK